ncbi:MAG TPA: diaminopimelate decarboxylase, partial [Thermoanaerobaculia bacterium]|nr:diaminopimelate decarboxylase [Thermoanaerobaculia bacterium]
RANAPEGVLVHSTPKKLSQLRLGQLSSVPVVGFFRKDGELTCDGVALSEIARAVGTPVYVYSAALIEENFRRFDAALAPVSHLVCYAAKANSNLTVLSRLADLGAGADVVSGGELRAVLECGFPADRVVFSGVGKTLAEIGAGIDAGVLAFNAESEREIEKIDAEAARRGKKARVALRVNPDIDAGSHPYISTGRKHNKFGIDIAKARNLFQRAGRFPNTTFVGVQAHIGSQILDPEPLAQSARELAALATSLANEGHPIETVDVGGGIGIGGSGETLTPERYAAAVLPHLTGLPFRILIEPGRAIVGPAGVLLTEVLYLKESSGKLFVVTDAGMNDLLRPALYGAIHTIEPVTDFRSGAPTVTADVVGPICESSDFFLRDAEIPRPEEGDLLAIGDVGAYGFAMASNYNFRGRPAEVWVEDGDFRVVRRRETFEDLLRAERE